MERVSQPEQLAFPFAKYYEKDQCCELDDDHDGNCLVYRDNVVEMWRQPVQGMLFENDFNRSIPAAA